MFLPSRCFPAHSRCDDSAVWTLSVDLRPNSIPTSRTAAVLANGCMVAGETAGLRWNECIATATRQTRQQRDGKPLKNVATVETTLTQKVMALEEVRSRAAFVARPSAQARTAPAHTPTLRWYVRHAAIARLSCPKPARWELRLVLLASRAGASDVLALRWGAARWLRWGATPDDVVFGD
ncbi:hypothetical protein SVAN01_03767 [Stagonosporopsis vannaccii]|nr:hypothetical protein SVAN01_03767 [Stagonosporopsis vannaccii]